MPFLTWNWFSWPIKQLRSKLWPAKNLDQNLYFDRFEIQIVCQMFKAGFSNTEEKKVESLKIFDLQESFAEFFCLFKIFDSFTVSLYVYVINFFQAVELNFFLVHFLFFWLSLWLMTHSLYFLLVKFYFYSVTISLHVKLPSDCRLDLTLFCFVDWNSV